MGSRITYYFDIDRNATSFTLNADYHIDPAYDPYTGAYYPRTNYEFDYTNSSGALIDSSSGSAGATVSVRDSFAFDTGPGVAVNRLDFAAENSADGYGFFYYWYVFDGARETGRQSISGTSDTDIIFGGRGGDTLRGLADDDWLDGGAGVDTLNGGTGDDTFVVDATRDKVVEANRAGDDAVRSSVSYSLATAANVETLDLTGSRASIGIGNALANTVAGNESNNRIVGAGDGDLLIGEGGSDTFQYYGIGDSTVAGSGRDTIRDFSRNEGDHIDLHLIDADPGAPGNQAFTFIGTDTFNQEAGELRYVTSRSATVVSGDTNGDGTADFAITLRGQLALNGGDFYL